MDYKYIINKNEYKYKIQKINSYDQVRQSVEKRVPPPAVWKHQGPHTYSMHDECPKCKHPVTKRECQNCSQIAVIAVLTMVLKKERVYFTLLPKEILLMILAQVVPSYLSIGGL
jgi:hypothetical protein